MDHQVNTQVAQIRQLLEQAHELKHKDAVKGLELAKTALAKFQALSVCGDQALEAEIYIALGKHLTQLTEFPEAYKKINHAIALFESLGNIDKQIDCWQVLSVAHFRFGEPADSVQAALRALDLLKLAPDKSIEARMLVGLGISYNKIGDYEQECACYERAEAIHATIDEPVHLASLKNNQAMVYMALQEYEIAFQYVDEALKLLQALESPYQLILTLCSAGEIRIKQGLFDEAEHYFCQSNVLCGEHRYQYGQTHIYHGFCMLSMAREQYRKANEFGHKMKQHAELNGVAPLIQTAHQLLSQSYKKLGEYELALVHFEAYHELHKKGCTDQMQRRLVNLRVIHETEQAEQAAEISALKNTVLEKEIENREVVERSLRKTNEELQTFAHMVAHDLRNPLSSMIIATELLIRILDTLTPAQIHERLTRMHGIAKQTAGVVDDLLMLALPCQGGIDLAELDTAVILSNVMNQIEPLMKDYDGTISLPYSWHEGAGYEPWIVQIWSNLISNAIKYGGRPYHVVLGSELVSDRLVRYWIDDNGRVIPPEMQDEIFKPFTRLEPRQASGTGLGLLIVQRIIERLNGRLGVESNAIGGNRFYFELPVLGALSSEIDNI